MIKIQREEALKLRKAWGNKPCNHPEWGKEYYLGANTGDYICLQCGEEVSEDGYKFLTQKSNGNK